MTGVEHPVEITAVERRLPFAPRHDNSPRVIEVDRLAKSFGSVHALDDLSFVVRPGHVTGFLGPNGAGKSTTMRAILGLDAPTSGHALIGGRDYRDLVRPLHQVGSLLDAEALHPGRSAWHHLRSVAQANGIAASRVQASTSLGARSAAGWATCPRNSATTRRSRWRSSSSTSRC